MAEEEFPEKLVTERIAKIHELLERCSTLKKTIEGLTKLKKKLLAELKFLTSVSTDYQLFRWGNFICCSF